MSLDEPHLRRLRSWMLQEPQVERPKYQDNSDVCYQPRPELVPEEQDVHTDHDGYHREHVKHDDRLSSHRLFSPLRDGVEQDLICYGSGSDDP